MYKRLLFAPAVYREDGSGEDFEYLKYYGYRLSEELEQLFECHVQIHRGSAFLLSGQAAGWELLFRRTIPWQIF